MGDQGGTCINTRLENYRIMRRKQFGQSSNGSRQRQVLDDFASQILGTPENSPLPADEHEGPAYTDPLDQLEEYILRIKELCVQVDKVRGPPVTKVLSAADHQAAKDGPVLRLPDLDLRGVLVEGRKSHFAAVQVQRLLQLQQPVHVPARRPGGHRQKGQSHPQGQDLAAQKPERVRGRVQGLHQIRLGWVAAALTPVSHIRARKHKYIHFVDFQNELVTIADPYCLGLLDQHNRHERPYLYDIRTSHALRSKSKSLSILNRFSFTAQDDAAGNFALYLNEKLCRPETIDQQYIDHFNVDVFRRDFDYIRVSRAGPSLTNRASESGTRRPRPT